MDKLRDTLELVFRQQPFVTSRDLQQVLGISRQSVWKRLRPLVESGELKLESAGRGVRYAPGPGAPRERGILRGGCVWGEYEDESTAFWKAFAEEVPQLAYVSVRRATRGTLRREHGHALVDALLVKRFIVLDFSGIDRIGNAFAAALLDGCRGSDLATINAMPEVQRTLHRARRRLLLRPMSDTCE